MFVLCKRMECYTSFSKSTNPRERRQLDQENAIVIKKELVDGIKHSPIFGDWLNDQRDRLTLYSIPP